MSYKGCAAVTVVGGGCWGTTIASIVAQNVPRVTIWARDAEVVHSINSSGVNERFLSGYILPKNIVATTNFENAFIGTELVIWAIPVQFTRQRLRDCREWLPSGVVVVNLSKGLEIGTWYRPSQIISQECSDLKAIGSLGGANIASEIIRGSHAEATLAMTAHWEMQGLERLFTTPAFQVRLSADLLALELAGALKNVVAIAAGICDGLASGANAKATMVARGFDEIRALGRALGANPESFISPFGLGDLLATASSIGSRNRALGEQLGKGNNLDQAILALNGRVAEGVATTQACGELISKLGLRLPLLTRIGEVLSGKLTAHAFSASNWEWAAQSHNLAIPSSRVD